jgi:hypothetical protein
MGVPQPVACGYVAVMEYEVEITLTVEAEDPTQATLKAADAIFRGLDVVGWRGKSVDDIAALPSLEEQLAAWWN